MSSHDSGASSTSGGKRSRAGLDSRFATRKVSRTLSYQHIEDARPQRSRTLDWMRARKSLQNLRSTRIQRTLGMSSTANEEWDLSSLKRSQVSPLCHFPASEISPLCDPRPESKPRPKTKDKPELKSAMKKTSAGPSESAAAAKRSVTFGERRVSTYREAVPDAAKWYSNSEIEKFKADANAHATNVRRVMKYASMVEDSYNSSIGLISPRVLSEYLSCPHEIIGIEHLLAGQDAARKSLAHHQAKNFLEVQRRLREEGEDCDPKVLAEVLGGKSRILGHMARERAAYVAQMED